MNLSEALASATPLAARLRPRRLGEIAGQEKLLRSGSPIRRLLDTAASGSATSVILWGPPGTGKTSIAQVIALESKSRFEQLSAISAGVKEVRGVIDRARDDAALYHQHTVLFLDEIHRFSKAQQDSLLPAVEAGWVTLIAATTENPSFSIISPLLSRAVVVKLEPLTAESLDVIIDRALEDQRGFSGTVEIDEEARELLKRISQGDARRALTALEASTFVAFQRDTSQTATKVTSADVEESLNVAQARYDRTGDGHYDTISAFIKSVRGSDADAALHYLARMINAGEDPRFIARRLIILASEDVGLADPSALGIAVSAAEAVAQIGMPEGRIPLAEATIYLALAPKSNSAYTAINEAISDVENGMVDPIPPHLRGTGYSDAAKYGSGVGYQYPHDLPASVARQEYAPEAIKDRTYYRPKPVGKEMEFVSLWRKIRALIRGEKPTD